MGKFDKTKVDDLSVKFEQATEEIAAELEGSDFLEPADIQRTKMEICSHARNRLDALRRLSEQNQAKKEGRNSIEQLQKEMKAFSIKEEINFSELHLRLDMGERVFLLGHDENDNLIVLDLRYTDEKVVNNQFRDILIIPRDVKDFSVRGQYDRRDLIGDGHCIEEGIKTAISILGKIQICDVDEKFQDQAEATDDDWRVGIEDYNSRRDEKMRQRIEGGELAVCISERIGSKELFERLEKDGQIFVLGSPSWHCEPEPEGRVIHFYNDDGVVCNMRDLDDLVNNPGFGFDSHDALVDITKTTLEDWEEYYGINPEDIHVLESTEPFSNRMKAIKENPKITDEELIM